jgi:hypothetical protein
LIAPFGCRQTAILVDQVVLSIQPIFHGALSAVPGALVIQVVNELENARVVRSCEVFRPKQDLTN